MIHALFNAPRIVKRFLSVSFDALAMAAAYYLASCMRLGTLVPPIQSREVFTISITIAISLFIFIRLGMYRAVLRYMSAQAMITIGICACVSGLVLAIVSFYVNSYVPRSVPFIYSLLLFITIGTPRLLVRSIVQMLNHRVVDRTTSVLIYGAGHTGHQLAVALQATPYKVVGFIDDNPLLHRTTVAGIKVYGAHSLPQLLQNKNAEKVLLALGSASHAARATVLKKLEPLAIEVQTVPAVADILSGKTKIEQIKDVDIEDLLGRDPVKPNPKLMHACIENKIVMVTGAGGSIGSELCRQIVKQRPKTLILFELNEYALYSIEQELRSEICGQEIELVPLLGSVQNRERLESVMSIFAVQTVYHAAAYKHVPLVEHNIVEGVRNNIFGTWYCAEAAIAAKVESFVLISTDKAVRPTNIMGATKRMAELVLQALAQRQKTTRFTMVRFGNVLGSSGSVVPLFRKQIKAGGPVTVTHPDIIRYFMTIPEAAELVIQAGSMGLGGDVFVLDMGDPVKIVDLARRMIHLSGLEIKDEAHLDGDIAIEYTGLRPGEKLYEELLIGDNVSGTEHSRIMSAQEVCLSWPEAESLILSLATACDSYKCDDVKSILLAAPAGYRSTESLDDSVWVRKDKGSKLRVV
ncbi:nucleoside-diphosphate sugar epimerase/dehydratase [Cellvibrio sp. BR]|uniref:polysaccharide biosynthesis protein n=1 Tax=Cellvibrio sp. BR TaxID=1134474 RepID=UPI0002DF0194|nr:nucleoside-diphosphate sugar epimerase/dehydratase [Cellvibrio sp. BR]